VTQDPAVSRGGAEDGSIVEPGQSAAGRGPEVDRRFEPHRRGDDLLIEVGVGLEAEGHPAALVRRASASLW
jgi:hypothetical protein